jgi:hypothetical protein
MTHRTAVVLITLLLAAPSPGRSETPASRGVDERTLERALTTTVQPFFEQHCNRCHGGEKPKADLDLRVYTKLATVVRDHAQWETLLEKLVARQMPPDSAEQPPEADRQKIIAWVESVRQSEARKHAGDPGVVLARRLSNAEYNYTIRDLTGVDLRPTREFPVDPANPAGFDNSGESLAMSPALLGKYLQAAREVANHLVFKPEGLAFAPHPMLVETDRDKYCVTQIVDFYRRQATDFADYFQAAWRFKHRAALGKPRATLAQVAADSQVSPKYLALVWRTLEQTREEVGPLAKLQAMWKQLPAPVAGADAARPGCEQMRTFVVRLRAKIEPRFAPLEVPGMRGTAQPFLMWKNRQYAAARRSYDRDALQIDGQVKTPPPAPRKRDNVEANEVDDEDLQDRAVVRSAADPDLTVPSGDRARYEAAFARFASVFPDAFYIAERGRNYLDSTKDKGRLLSAGFHNLMGYFRDDQPLYELLLDDKQQKQLDAMWRELDYVADATSRTYRQFYFSESGEARKRGASAAGGGAGAAPASARVSNIDGESDKAAVQAADQRGVDAAADKDVTTEPMIKQVRQVYLARLPATANPSAGKAIEQHFDTTNQTLRWVEKARAAAEPRQLESLTRFAERAYRRPLTAAERQELLGYYRGQRESAGLDHQEALRDALVSVLMSPDFCYRIDLVERGPGVRPLSDHALASRLSYFLWSSAPDDELLAQARAGQLHRPEVLVRQTRRMLKDPRVRALATEFGGNWLDFRRFEEHNAVDRERFPSFDNDLRQAMFEEPVRFLVDVFQNNRPVLELLYAKHTFVNPVLAKHYGMPDTGGTSERWVRVEDAEQYGRGGLLPMAAFLTKNAPGLRTSPVKRGYWVVKNVLGERIPPPPAVVPELPRDEAKADLPLRELLARHREDAACAGCHARFDSMGLVLEGYGPIGEKRTQDLAGRPVEARAAFPGKGGEASGLSGLRDYVRAHRQDDFVDNVSRKLLAYGLGRSVMLSDEETVQQMRARLARDGFRFGSLVESVVTSRQFLTKRGRETGAVAKGAEP